MKKVIFSLIMFSFIYPLAFAQQQSNNVTWKKVPGEQAVIQIVKDSNGKLITIRSFTVQELHNALDQVEGEYSNNRKILLDAIKIAVTNDDKK
jgi:hypothetical protein